MEENEGKRDISSQIVFLSMAARLAKITMDDKKCEFMFRVAELLIEKGGKTTMEEITDILDEVETDIKERVLDKKKKEKQSKEQVWGGTEKSFLSKNLNGIHAKIDKERS